MVGDGRKERKEKFEQEDGGRWGFDIKEKKRNSEKTTGQKGTCKKKQKAKTKTKEETKQHKQNQRHVAVNE